MTHPFLDASIPELVSKLTTDEKISLLGAPNWWNTSAVPRLGIPSVRMSDGPNVREFLESYVGILWLINCVIGCQRVIAFRIYTRTVSSCMNSFYIHGGIVC